MNTGKQISFYGKDISKDGKILRITLKGIDEKGIDLMSYLSLDGSEVAASSL